MPLLLLLTLLADPAKMPAPDAPDWRPVGDAGLKAWDVTAGTGKPVKAGDTLRFHITGWTAADGKVFYSSRKNNATDTQPLDKLVKGAREGLAGARPGGVRRLLVPPGLGYDRARPGVPAGSTLVLEVELFDDPLVLPDPDSPQWKDAGDALKVWDVAVGSGAECPAGATVLCHYTGWLTDGTRFDSSVTRGQPTSFSLGGVVQGWGKGIPGMKEGGIRRLLIPYPLGYGEAGKPPTIPPRATLVFEIELRKVEK